MPADFLDTSALAKHYHTEVGSTEVDRLWNDPARGFFVSRLSVLEMVSVFARKVRSGTISSVDFDVLQRRFSADLTKSRRLTGARLLVVHYQDAERLLRQHGLARRLRTLDALQLAVAVDLHRNGAIQRVISADKDLLEVARCRGHGDLQSGKPLTSLGTKRSEDFFCQRPPTSRLCPTRFLFPGFYPPARTAPIAQQRKNRRDHRSPRLRRNDGNRSARRSADPLNPSAKVTIN